ncbi:MAG: hypothetical protein HFJ18_00760 [Clostridia bacterium]|nr:hypothetical protein [Clostridia bacterium]
MKKSNINIEELVNVEVNKIKEAVITVNDDRPLFSKQDYEIVEGEPKYFELDEYDRSSGAIALISNNTMPLVTKKRLKYPSPSGWNKSLENKNLFEKCHIIAYSLSAKLAVPKNIFIGTIDLNKSYMKKVENEIVRYIKDNKVRIIYRVTIKYKGTDQIPTGVLIEAQSIDDDFRLCRFCYNLQSGVKFKYSNGTVISDKRILPKIKRKIEFKVEKIPRKIFTNYIINTRAKEFHLMNKKYTKLRNVNSKNIQETTAIKQELLDKGLKPCDKCIINNAETANSDL